MSAINRQQIGIVKRQIRKTLGELQREDFKPTQLQTLTDNELLNVYESHTSAHEVRRRTPTNRDRTAKTTVTIRTLYGIRRRFPAFLRTVIDIPQPTAVSSVQVHPPIQYVETSNLSFVDASILSKLDLPVFEGNLLDFPEFWQRFSTVVGDKPQLDDATKFSLLKSTLRGCALQTIKGLSVTSANYSLAVEILKNHFDGHVTTRNILYTRTSLSSSL
ncbi:hypothetical protein NECAME_17305 [Necator americanus]|uniref:Uncharacterized protein n=1 Tax=Necator americanus TaxID=51031 RepID=W2TSI1_NECAM|nr:hypothetical protein NECAME_17305 [Necator americanus]ETN83982.1 hypothetical protein NECAME_17305 [Necator americanus]